MEDGNFDSPVEHALNMLCFLYSLNAVNVQAGQIFRFVNNQLADYAKRSCGTEVKINISHEMSRNKSRDFWV